MIKIGEKRYHPDEIKVYYPHETPSGDPSIIFEWRNKDLDTVLAFDNEAERDMHIKAMDEAYATVLDGVVVERSMDISPLVYGGGPFEGDGGMNLQ
jgi:hypothetical protein